MAWVHRARFDQWITMAPFRQQLACSACKLVALSLLFKVTWLFEKYYFSTIRIILQLHVQQVLLAEAAKAVVLAEDPPQALGCE